MTLMFFANVVKSFRRGQQKIKFVQYFGISFICRWTVVKLYRLSVGDEIEKELDSLKI